MNNQTFKILEVTREQLEEPDAPTPASILEACGLAQGQLNLVLSLLARPEDEQDPEQIFQALITIACACMSAAGDHVMPRMGWEEEE